MKTIFITGASSGIGKATAEYFATNGWNVVATMRSPEKEVELTKLPNITLLHLDVLDEKSIADAVQSALQKFTTIDVLFNNAGYGLIGAFETMTPEQIEKQFATNVFGVMNTIRALLPHFRERKNGTIITTTSMGGLITFPIYSVYHGTKWALEGFLESLQFELKQFNIKVKNVEPGAIKTDFYTRSMQLASNPNVTAYDAYVNATNAFFMQTGQTAPGPEVVAKKVFEAANDQSFRLRYPVGGIGPILLLLRKLLPTVWFIKIMGFQIEKGFKKP
jgi:NAD(P)-dependent dehydrogenase (short-subunit alcohol dehydrogenase family)